MLKMNEGAEIFVDAMSEHTAAAQKEKIVFDEAFTLHHRTVFRAARSVVQDAGLAEDVTQDVFVALTKSAARFDPAVASLSTYLYGIARNMVL